MTVTRIALVSDSHLSPRTPEAGAHWDAVVRAVAASAVDLVIHVGDLTLDGAHDPSELSYARSRLDELAVPWNAVPGNHDLGDNPVPGAARRSCIDDARHDRWNDVVGPDRWRVAAAGWNLLGIDAQLLGSGLDAEHRQWTWLEDQLDRVDRRCTLALVSHKPWAAPDDELAVAPPHRFVPARARGRLAELLGDRAPALVISGHVHQQRRIDLPGTTHLWVPTTWAVLSDEAQETFGAKRSGLVLLDLSSDGTFDAQSVEPPGLPTLTIGADVANPYRHRRAPARTDTARSGGRRATRAS